VQSPNAILYWYINAIDHLNVTSHLVVWVGQSVGCVRLFLGVFVCKHDNSFQRNRLLIGILRLILALSISQVSRSMS